MAQNYQQAMADRLSGRPPYNTGINGKATTADEPMRLETPEQAGAGWGISKIADQLGGTIQPTPAPPVGATPANVSGGAGPFQSGNASVSGYLQDAMNAFAPTIRGIADEAGRKKALNDYVSSLAPEVEKRGGHMSDIRGDGATVDGRRIDFFGDIEGKALPQYLDVTDQANAPQGMAARPMFAGSTIAPALQGDAQGNIQQALSQFGQAQDGSLIQQLIAKLQGGQ